MAIQFDCGVTIALPKTCHHIRSVARIHRTAAQLPDSVTVSIGLGSGDQARPLASTIWSVNHQPNKLRRRRWRHFRLHPQNIARPTTGKGPGTPSSLGEADSNGVRFEIKSLSG